ncbi:MAG TPA: TIGR03013 family PEP-CTERM/XrtA system glycosyltransferase [Chromatiaceae bacterium]|nr:TIGR03013 family PEP-CTERM/XrtA system glycosyltransferase [Chromatiaceae bacterium]
MNQSNSSASSIMLPLIIIEAIIFIGSVYVAVAVRFMGATHEEIASSVGLIFPEALVFACVMMPSMAAMGLYQSRSREEPIGMFARVLAAFVLGSILSIILFYVFPQLYLGRGVFALTLLFSLLAIGTVRPLFFQFVNERSPGIRVLILGAGEKASNIPTRMRRRADRRGIQIVGFLPATKEEIRIDESLLLSPSKSLLELVKEHDIDEIVVAQDERRANMDMQQLLECKLAGINIIDLPTLFERQTGQINLNLLAPSWLIFSRRFRLDPVSQMLKRTFDLIVSLIICILTSPIMLITALAIWIESSFKGPIFFRQKRVGENGKLFDVLKFRSMKTDAESDGKARWAEENDDRITRVGSFIRKVRIDELPQCWNVIKGEMSFVGPRPERPEFVKELEKSIPYYDVRHVVKPGLTGWAQLCYPYGANENDAKEKLKFDLYYVKHQSLRFDIIILLRTVEVVLFGKGAR